MLGVRSFLFPLLSLLITFVVVVVVASFAITIIIRLYHPPHPTSYYEHHATCVLGSPQPLNFISQPHKSLGHSYLRPDSLPHILHMQRIPCKIAILRLLQGPLLLLTMTLLRWVVMVFVGWCQRLWRPQIPHCYCYCCCCRYCSGPLTWPPSAAAAVE